MIFNDSKLSPPVNKLRVDSLEMLLAMGQGQYQNFQSRDLRDPSAYKLPEMLQSLKNSKFRDHISAAFPAEMELAGE